MTTSEKATLYDRYRLPYAGEAVRDLLAHIGRVQVVADIGAGTGQLARLFAGHAARVYAVEPDPAMRAVAATALAGYATVEVRAGSAEQTALASGSADLIVVGNAFHRFKPEACAELRRSLKPSGWIALFGYNFLNAAFTEKLFPRLAALPRTARRIEQAWPRTPIANLFGAAPLQTLRYRQTQPEDWTAFFGSACSGIEAPVPGDEEFAAFETINHEVFAEFAVDGAITIEYETEVTFGRPNHPLNREAL